MISIDNEDNSNSGYKNTDTSFNLIDISKLQQNLKSFQNNLDKTLNELLNRREIIDLVTSHHDWISSFNYLMDFEENKGIGTAKKVIV